MGRAGKQNPTAEIFNEAARQEMKNKLTYKHTISMCYIGYVSQAIVINFAPLLFLTFNKGYGISLEKISLLITINFTIQLIMDFVSAYFIDKIGYRTSIICAHLLCSFGLVALAFLPDMFSNPFIGLIISYVLFASGGGLIEVLISPTVEACPTDNKASQMSLLHSAYCFGQMTVVLLSTLFFGIFGITEWKILAVIWAAVPLLNAVYAIFVPINVLGGGEKTKTVRQVLTTPGFYYFAVLMICAGASENAMSQWASAFAEAGLSVDKTLGDLLGPCMFALLMGISRVFMSKISKKYPLDKLFAASSVLCIAAYLIASLSPIPWLALAGCAVCGISVAVMWPGTYSLASERYPDGGTAMFALLALGGDVGCVCGPSLVGLISGKMNGELKWGLLFSIVFPLVSLAAIGFVSLRKRNQAKNNVKSK